MDYFKSEIRTGLVVLICFVLLISLVIGINGTKTLATTSSYTLLFKDVVGLEEDAPVNYAGYEVGKIKAIRLANTKERSLYPEYNIAASIIIDSNVIIKDNSVTQIKSMGYLGLKYIDISSGSLGSQHIEPKSTILGYTPQDINEIMDCVGSFIKEIKPKINKILDGINNMVGEEGSITLAVEELSALIKDADEMIVVNKEDIRNIIKNLNETGKHLKAFSADIENNPWKLLRKTSNKKKDEEEGKKDKNKKGKKRSKQNWK